MSYGSTADPYAGGTHEWALRLLTIGGLVSLIAATAYVLWATGVDQTIGTQAAQQVGLRPKEAEGSGAAFTETEARGRATDAAIEFLFREDGPAARLAEQGRAAPTRDGLAIKGVQFAKDARKVSSADVISVTSEFPRPMSIWTVSFSAPGLAFLEVRLEDGTGRMRGATAQLAPRNDAVAPR